MTNRVTEETSKHASTTNWHTLTAAEVRQKLGCEKGGLSHEEATQRLEKYGANRLTPPKKRGPLQRFLLQFHNLLLYVMIGAAVITAVLGFWIDTGVLMLAVVLNAIIGFIQEGKAESALDAIRSMLSLHATVIRDGQRQDIDASELVPGDLVALSSGDRVPADLRLVNIRNLRIEEAALTGESLAVDKHTEEAAQDAPLGDRFNMAYSGTTVVYGKALGIVVATGANTELGKINQMLADIRHLTTPLIRQVDYFARQLAFFILGLSAIVFLLGTLWRGNSASDMLMMVVALTASAIPEGLPALMTVTLALGVRRMAQRNAIVRRLPAVEALGSVTVICSDKTGTLTRNEMTVQRIIGVDYRVHVEGIGYAPEGNLLIDRRPISLAEHPELDLAIRAGILCNDARLHQEDGNWRIVGDPTEGALRVLGQKAGIQLEPGVNEAWARIDAIPFESQHRFMATYHCDEQNSPWIFAKGAPERILDMCSRQLGKDGESALDIDYWRRMATDMAAQGLRLLAIGYKCSAPHSDLLDFSDMSSDFVMLALIGIVDPPREEAVRAVADCHRAGIRVKMITGDHVETARAIGEQLNIGVGKAALTGAEVAVMDDDTLRTVVMEVDIFARAAPEHKLRLVQALQDNQQVVAMTGDGVNDAPALKRADVGVAMGLKGTDAAKEASDIVLADDNFATIASAVSEGRAIYDNLKKFILFVLPTNGGEMLVVIAAILFELVLPLTPAQVLWVNMATSGTLGLALAFEPTEKGIMDRRPRPPTEPLLSGFFIWRVIMVSIVIMIGALGVFLWELNQGTSLEVARTMTVNIIVVCEMVYLFNSRHTFLSVINREGLFGNRYVLIAIAACIPLQLLYTYAPFMQTIFNSAGLSLLEWLKVFGAAFLLFFVAEFEKFVVRKIGLASRLQMAK
ncbi:MAG: cation-transporting P-type ATPase [Alcaligenaceae bacterium]|nr:cation-transporting P-type ATPase [Alcaligenaceae bacterium]